MQSQLDGVDDDTAGEQRAGLVARPGWAVAAVAGLILAVMVAWTQKVDPLPGRLGSPAWYEWLRYPIETNAMRRLPGAPSTMLDVQLRTTGPGPKQQQVWAVGRGGGILFSQDGGESWTAQTSRTESDLFDVTFDDKGQVGWAVGAGGTVLRTLNGGTTWTVIDARRLLGADAPKDKPADLGSMTSVQALPPDGRVVLVASQRGRVFKSGDGGETWAEQPVTAALNELVGLRFERTGQRGWVAGRGIIGWTSDGGTTWQPAKGLPEDMAGVQLELPRFLDNGLVGWTVARNGAVLYTDDGGKSWRERTRVTRRTESDRSPGESTEGDAKAATVLRPVDLRGLHVHSEGKLLWATAFDGSIWRSEDGGEGWTEAAANTRTFLRRIVMDDAGRRGWAVGSDGVILSTDDGGRSWAKRTQGAISVMLASHGSEDGRHLWLAGHEGQMLMSPDGGQTWSPQDIGVGHESVHGVTFLADNRRGWAVTSRGSVVATRNGGDHWDPAQAVSPQRLRSIHASADGQRLWVAGDAGEVFHSDNGGRTWKRQKSDTRATINRIRFHKDGEHGWAVGGQGTLLRTADGGRTWKAEPLKPEGRDQPLRRSLRDLVVHDDGRQVWIVGDGGIILHTDDAGATWVTRDSRTRSSLLALDFARDGGTGWAAGEGGAIVVTLDGGQTWNPAATVGSARTTVAMDATGKTGWAFGYAPSLLQTTDYGASWTPLPWPVTPERLPAPWFWIALVFVGAAMWHAFRPIPAPDARGVEAMGTTDAPTEDFARDRLQFAPLARGISRFLRNTRTEPPLTIAISGDWGSGKSSLMALACADLRRYGSRPVWFNAWHHQSEEQMLAALLTGIRDQGLPPLHTPDGWVFRLRLLWLRSHKHFVYTLLALLALAALTGYLIKTRGNPVEWTNLALAVDKILPTLQALAKGTPPPPSSNLQGGDLGLLISQLFALSMGAFGLRRALQAFGADPAVLAAKTAANFKMKDASAQTGFRARYAEQFEEVTKALPYRLVIVIDDLDRCKPEAVLSVMEAVNFLVSSGNCFVIFGMSTTRVEAALALAFEKIAKELVELDVSLPPNATPEQKERAERERRRAYVRDYLEKLINLEITVPQRADLPPEALLTQVPRDDTRTLLRQALAFWPLLVGAAVIFVGIGLGRSDLGSSARASFQSRPAAAVAGPTAGGEGDSDNANTTTAARAPTSTVSDPSRPASMSGLTVRPSDSRSLIESSASPVAWPLAAVFIAFVLATGGTLIYRVRNSHRHVEDTVDFAEALRIWLPVVARRRSTPRVIKRFGNRLRYLAMLQQAELPEPSMREEFERRWRKLTGIGYAAIAQVRRALRAAHPPLAEHRLVALGALHYVYGRDWRARTATNVTPPPDDDGLHEAVANAVARYTSDPERGPWPPTDEELALFERALRGVRLSATLDSLRTTPPPPAAPPPAPA